MKLLSIVIPSYNSQDYMEHCIESLLIGGEDVEVIVVDDGSTDRTAEIADSYAQKYPTIVKAVHQENGGHGEAVNAGIRNASGLYFKVVDSDDWVEGDMLEKMAAFLSEGEDDKKEIICCNFVINRPGKETEHFHGLKPGIYEGEYLQGEIKDNLLGHENRKISMSRCMKLCEKSVFEGNEKYYDVKLRMGDDFNLIYPALLGASRVVVMEGALFYHYRYVEDSIVHCYDPHNAESVEGWYKAIRRIIHEKKVPDGEKKLDREYCYMMMYVMKNELRNPGKDYIRKIQRIFMEPKTRKRITSTPLCVKSRSNALLYLGMQYPNKGLLRILRMIVKQHDRTGNRYRKSR